MLIHILEHSRESYPPTHRPLIPEMAGWSVPYQCFLRRLPPEGYRSISTIEPTQIDTGHIFEDPD